MSISPRSLRAPGVAAALGAALLVSALASMTSARTEALIGLRHSVFDNPHFEGPAVLERQSADFDIEAFVRQPGLPGRNMSMRWEGYWFLPTGGPVRVHALADDEARVWIDDRLMADWRVDAGYGVQETAELRPGLHRIRIEYVQYRGGAALSLEWGQPEYPLRQFVRERLFPVPPGEDVIIAAARARTLSFLQPVVWAVSLVAAGLLIGLAPVLRGLDDVRRQERWHRVVAFVSNRRYQATAAILVGIVMVAWAVRHRLGALGPVTFWNDDIWVVALASRPSLLEALSVPAPVPPGFVLLQWIARRWSALPGASLQIVPLASAILSGAGVAWLVARLTGSRTIGIGVLALALVDPLMAQLSVFSKQYTADALVTVGLLALVVRAAGPRPLPFGRAAAGGLLAVFFSFPAVFSSAALVHVLAMREVRGGFSTRRCRRALLGVALFDLALAAVIRFVLLNRSSPILERGWRRSFEPTGEVDAGMHFVSARAMDLLSRPFPEGLSVAAILAAVGLLWLFVDRRWRTVGWFVAATYAGLIAAAVMGFYPLGTGFQGRVVLFTHGLAIFLAGLGAGAVARAFGRRVALQVAAAGAVAWLLFASPVRVDYPDHDHSRIERELALAARDGDAVVVTAIGSYTVGVYGDWPSEVVRDRTATQFHLRFTRPLTVTLPLGQERDRVLLEDLEPMLTSERPPRVFFFSTRRDTTVAEAVIERAGYAQAFKHASTTSTFLILFERLPVRAGGARRETPPR